MFDRTQCRVRVYGAKRAARRFARYRYQYGRVYRSPSSPQTVKPNATR